MNKIPVILKPHPDELLYSWINRLADACGISLELFYEVYMNMPPYFKGSDGVPDIRKNFSVLWESLAVDKSMLEMYLSLTTFSFESMDMAPWHQARYLNGVFREKDTLNFTPRALFPKARICPACAAEDAGKYGKPYLRRAHQLSGVLVCSRHGCMLHEYQGKKGRECDYRPEDYKEIQPDLPLESLQAYAVYAEKLLDMQIDADSYRIQDAVLQKVRTEGSGPEADFNRFNKKFAAWEHSCLCRGKQLVRMLLTAQKSRRRMDVTVVVPHLMYLYPDPSALLPALKSCDRSAEEYVCRTCGRVFCSSPTAMRAGWGCPYCAENMPAQERYRKMVRTCVGDDYVPVSECFSMETNALYYHRPCGETMTVRPRYLLYFGARCGCGEKPKRKEEFEAMYPGFEFVRCNQPDKSLTLRHKWCGNEFRCMQPDFYSNPVCRVCSPADIRINGLAEYIKEWTNEEYTVIRIVYGRELAAVFRHNVCGCCSTCSIKEFLAGRQCGKCAGVLPETEKVAKMRSYRMEGKKMRTRSERERDAVSTFTGNRYAL